MKSAEVSDYRWELSVFLMLARLPLRETFLNRVPFALAIKSPKLLIWMSPGNSAGRKSFSFKQKVGFFLHKILCVRCAI